MKTKILSPLRRDGYKAGMIMMLIALSTMMLTTACSSEDDLAANNNEITNKKGFALPVTVNVTRQGDATTRATYTDNGDGTGSLGFSTGDKLFVYSDDGGSAGEYAGVLDWVSDGTFSGTITTQNPYTGTIDALLSGGEPAVAVLLPAGYGDYGYLSTGNRGAYNEEYIKNNTKAFVASTTEKTAKALAVEQFSFENAAYESGGFALVPNNAILNFTITGLTPSTEVTATLAESGSDVISGQVTPDGSGNATFAMAILGGCTFIKDLTLTVGGNVFSFTDSSVLLAAGKIYNIGRNASPLASVTTSDVGKVIGADGNIYANVAAAQAASTTACAIIAYVGSDTGESAPYNHGLAIAMKDAYDGNSTMWMWNDSEPHYSAVNPHQYTDIADALAAKESGSSLSSGKNNGTYPAFQDALANSITTETGISAAAPATRTSGWFMPSIFQWNQIVNGLTGTSSAFTTSQNDNLNYSAVNTKITAAGGVGLRNHYYWSSTEYDSYNAWMYVADKGKVDTDSKSVYVYVRAAFAF